MKPEFDPRYKYAVALGVEGGTVAPLKSYEHLEELKLGYKEWLDYATTRGLTKPVPIELIDNKGTCKILTAIIIEMNLPRN